MLKRGTLLLLMGAIALGGGVLLLEHFQGKNSDQGTQETSTAAGNNTSESDGERLFSFEEEEIESFVVNRGTDTVAFAKKDDDAWEMTKPETGLAEGGAIAFLLSQLTNRAVTTVTLESVHELSNFGLAEPNVTVDLVAAGKSYQVMLGDSDFSGDKRYIRVVDDQATDGQAVSDEQTANTPEPITIHVVSGSIVNAVNRPTSEWLMATEDNPSAENGAQAEPPNDSEIPAETGKDKSSKSNPINSEP